MPQSWLPERGAFFEGAAAVAVAGCLAASYLRGRLLPCGLARDSCHHRERVVRAGFTPASPMPFAAGSSLRVLAEVDESAVALVLLLARVSFMGIKLQFPVVF